jgi:hypothetical protein
VALLEAALADLASQCRELLSKGGDEIPHVMRLAASGDDEALNELRKARETAKSLLNLLDRDYGLTVAIPRNVDIAKDFELVVWPDPIPGSPFYGLLFLARFSFSIFKSDGKAEYEPLEIVFLKAQDNYVPIYAYGRVHYDLCEYKILGLHRLRILYFYHGHTPYIDGVGYVRLKCPKVKRSAVHVGRKYWDRIWLGAATTFLRLVGVQEFRLSDLVRLGLVKVMKCPNDFVVNPFNGPLFRRGQSRT